MSKIVSRLGRMAVGLFGNQKAIPAPAAGPLAIVNDRMQMWEHATCYDLLLRVPSPGFKKEDFVINIVDSLVIITAVARKFIMDASGVGSRDRFLWSFTLPRPTSAGIAGVSFQDGLLKLVIPKS